MKKSNNSLDHQIVLSVFHNVLVHVCIWTAIVTIHNVGIPSCVVPPQFVLEEVVDKFIDQSDIGYMRDMQFTTTEEKANG